MLVTSHLFFSYHLCPLWSLLLYTCTLFILLIFRSYRSGYEAAAKHFTPGDLDVKVSGRSFVITGANSGIGKRAALEIANRGECPGFGCVWDQMYVFNLLWFPTSTVKSSKLQIRNASNEMDTVAWACARIWPKHFFLQAEQFTWCVVTRSGQKQQRMRSLIRVKIRQEALQNVHTFP